MRAARGHERVRNVLWWAEIVGSVLALFIMPFVILASIWWLIPEAQMDVWERLFLGVGVVCFYLMTVIMWMSEHKGTTIRPHHLQKFHHAERALSNLQWLEVELLLERFPHDIPRVASWVAQYQGGLRLRHLWELRRTHVAGSFYLDVVETQGAHTPGGKDLDARYHKRKRPVPQVGSADILKGKLVALQAPEPAL